MVVQVAEQRQVGGIGTSVPDGWHTRTEAARLVGRSYDTVRRWHDDGVYEPSGWRMYGSTKVWLYSDADIEAMKEIVKTMGPGRPPSGDKL